MPIPVPGVGDVVTSVGLVREAFRKVVGRPTTNESGVLRRYAKRLNERRVFYASYHSEVEDACVWSLREMSKLTEECLAEMDHEAARAALGAILDATRRFVDKWHGFGPRHRQRWRDAPGSPWHMAGEEVAQFFEDLGEVRAVVRQMVELLREIEPTVSAPNLLRSVEK